jgi:hypothetical protein
MSYIDGQDMVFNNDDNNIHTGGFSVNSILMKGGFSPIITLNGDKNQNQTGGYQNVSDIFNSLVVPNWALSYHNKMAGGAYNDDSDYEEDDSEDEEDEDIQGGKKVVSEDIHDKLIKLVTEHDNIIKQKRKKLTKKFLKGKNNKSKRNNKR